MTEAEKKSLEETAENMAKENGWTKEQAYNYVRKMTYTSDDAAGCILISPDYSQCEACILNFEKTPYKCLAYEKMKPDDVCFKNKKCEYRRTE